MSSKKALDESASKSFNSENPISQKAAYSFRLFLYKEILYAELGKRSSRIILWKAPLSSNCLKYGRSLLDPVDNLKRDSVVINPLDVVKASSCPNMELTTSL